jgi:5-methylcytosine-specific restriction endonuclease McrA
MAYSSIVKKFCKCGCGKPPTISFDGWFYAHAPAEIKDRQGKKAKKSYQASLSRARNGKLSREVKKYAKLNDALKSPKKQVKTDLDIWFEERRMEMQGTCTECNQRINIKDDKYFRWSVCHIVPKSLVKSVATNPFNFVELCWLHHQEFDAGFDRAAKMMCFPEVKQKFQLFKHLIPAEEMRKVNPHLLT